MFAILSFILTFSRTLALTLLYFSALPGVCLSIYLSSFFPLYIFVFASFSFTIRFEFFFAYFFLEKKLHFQCFAHTALWLLVSLQFQRTIEEETRFSRLQNAWREFLQVRTSFHISNLSIFFCEAYFSINLFFLLSYLWESGAHADIPCLLEMILDSCDSGIGGCDHTGMTLFDIKERVSDSSLKCLKPIISRAMISIKKGR